jgi:RNA polymerase sigma factor (sigma-70 family)
MNRVLPHLPLHGGALTDGQLLESFLSRRDEAAFAALVRRHGPMVFGVCRRVLGNRHDAEDAFQAAFLVLVRRAASLRSRELLGNYLYGVAYRTALKARVMTARRRVRERRAGRPARTEPDGGQREELLALLDQHLSRLPEKYRTAVVLCELEGKSRKEAAALLRIPEGTVSSRLAKARRPLARRLAAAGAVPVVLGGTLTCLPAGLQAATARAALLMAGGEAAAGVIPAEVAVLTEGVLRTMMLAKFKTAAAVVFGVAVLTLGTGGLVYRARAVAAEPPQAQADDRDPAPARRQPDEAERARKEADELRERAETERRRAEEAQKKAEALAAQAVRERERAEHALREAQEQRDAHARAEEEVAAARRLLEEREAAAKVRPAGGDSAVKELAQELKRVAEQSEQLKVQLEQIEARKRQLQALLEKRQNELEKKAAVDHQGDKLDRILERLERMEKRLERLEQRR